MKKSTSIIILLLCAVCLWASDGVISGSFTGFKTGDKKSGWIPNTSFRKNNGMGSFSLKGPKDHEFVRFTTGDKQVFHLQGPAYPVLPGSKVEITALVRGKGSFRMSGYIYNAENRWLINIFPPSAKINASDGEYQLKKFTVSVPTEELRNRGLAAKFCPVIVIDNASEIDIENVTLKVLAPELPPIKDPSGFDANFHAEFPGMTFAGQPVFTGIEFGFDSAKWTRNEKIIPSRFRRYSSDGYNYAVYKRDYDNGFSCSLVMRWNRNGGDITMDYTIPADSPIVNISCEVRLDRKLFEYGAPGEIQLGEAKMRNIPDKITLNTYLGKLECSSFETGEGKKSPTMLRSTFHQFWRQEDQKTYGLLYGFVRPQGKKVTRQYKFSFKMTDHPAQDESVLAFALLNLHDKKTIILSSAEQKSLRKIMRGEVSAADAKATINKIIPRVEKALAAYTDSYFRVPEKPVIIPRPQKLTWQNGEMKISSDTVILIAENASGKLVRAAGFLQQEIKEVCGLDLPVIRGFNIPAGKNAIMIGTVKDQVFADAAKKLNISAADPGPQGYGLTADSNATKVIGCDEDGAFMGMWSVTQLISGKYGAKVIPAVEIRDYPVIKQRALIFEPRYQATINYIKLSMRQVAARHKANVIFLGSMERLGLLKWKSHPEIALDERAWSVEQIKEMIDYARSLNLKVIPCARAFGKVPMVFKVYPQWQEGKTGNANAFCLSQPEIRTFLAEIYDEIIEIWQPDIILIPFDEIDPIGTCPKCRNTPAADLVYNHMMWIYNYFKSRGVKLMICQDMLLEKSRWRATTPANSAADSGNRYRAVVHPVLDRLPKDIIIHDWNYTDLGRYPELPYFKSKGFPLAVSSWNLDYNNYYLARDAVKTGVDLFATNSFNFLNCRSVSGISLLGFEYPWNPDSPKPENLPYRSDRRLHEVLFGKVAIDSIFKELNYGPVPSAKAADSDIFTIRLDNYVNRSLRDDRCGDGKGWFDLGAAHDMRFFAPGKKILEGLPFEVAGKNGEAFCIGVAGKGLGHLGLPTSVDDIAVNEKVRSLIFLHSCNFIYEKVAGHYVIKYDDGSEYIVNLQERYAVSPWERPVSFSLFSEKMMYSGYYLGARRVWVGLNLAGQEVDLQAFEWVNPQPDKKVVSVSLKADAYNEAAVMLLAVSAVKNKDAEK